MTWTKVDEMTVDGVKYEIKLDTGTGKFLTLTENQERIEAPSLNALKDKLRKLTRGKPVAIPVTIADSDDEVDRIRHGVVTGIHGRTRRIMFREEGDDYVSQVYAGQAFHSRFTPAEEQEFRELCKERDDAVEALVNWLGEREIDVEDELAKARGLGEEKKA